MDRREVFSCFIKLPKCNKTFRLSATWTLVGDLEGWSLGYADAPPLRGLGFMCVGPRAYALGYGLSRLRRFGGGRRKRALLRRAQTARTLEKRRPFGLAQD